MKPWLVKVKFYSGGESIVGDFDTIVEAQQWADGLNNQYQTDTYRVEEFDPEKMTGWGVPQPVLQEFVKEMRRNV